MSDFTFTEAQASAMLDWVIRSPALLGLAPEPALCGQPRVDLAALAQALGREKRLGKRFEVLVAAWLAADHRYELLSQDEAIHVGGRTLGAPDLIVLDKETGSLEHWELTVKFYLGLEAGWLGPGKRDWLEEKAAHLATHQLPLLQKAEARDWLEARGWRIDNRRLLSRGMLFGHGPHRDYVRPEHAQGHWYQAHNLPRGDWFELERWQWIAKVELEELRPLRKAIDRPLMIAREANACLERHFVVPTGWPK
ncbi:DUF1853 family protein [Gallaecimonas sp. GXIMD4217]|uniref:DUF1853 family protein n=1 Tax=Gallaecimonas sp. GXIMD4217 TaxID=3131927 RepID=UPI00311B2135